MCGDHHWPQPGRERMIVPQPIALAGTGRMNPERALLERVDADHVFMMGDNPALPPMPERPTLLDFFHARFNDIAVRHLLTSAKLALDDGHDEKTVLACLLHDISIGCLLRSDHGYWGAQMIAPYVDPEVAWAVKYHQPLRYFADPSVGYQYPQSYEKFFGADYQPPAYIKRDADYARNHPWYMTSRIVTLYDLYFLDDQPEVDPGMFEDLIGRNFKQPEEGLGFDSSPVAHMWRTMIWPNNFL